MQDYIKLIHEQEKKAIGILYEVFHGKFSWLPSWLNLGKSEKNEEIQKAINEAKIWSLNIEKLPYGFEVINKKAQAEQKKKEKLKNQLNEDDKKTLNELKKKAEKDISNIKANSLKDLNRGLQ